VERLLGHAEAERAAQLAGLRHLATHRAEGGGGGGGGADDGSATARGRIAGDLGRARAWRFFAAPSSAVISAGGLVRGRGDYGRRRELLEGGGKQSKAARVR
jgi:hypothetical protein